MNFNRNVLEIENIGRVVQSLQTFIREQVNNNFRKRGVVIGISGGIDSAVAVKLCCDAVGKENVLGSTLEPKTSSLDILSYLRK